MPEITQGKETLFGSSGNGVSELFKTRYPHLLNRMIGDKSKASQSSISSSEHGMLPGAFGSICGVTTCELHSMVPSTQHVEDKYSQFLLLTASAL